MNIGESKKVMMDKISLEMESLELDKELQTKEKQIEKIKENVSDAEYRYSQLENSGVKKFFLSLAGKKEERLQESQNEIRKMRSELSSAEFELDSMKNKLEEINQTREEIEDVCVACLNTIAETDGEEIKTQIVAVLEIPRLYEDIRLQMRELSQLLSNAYDIFTILAPQNSSTLSYTVPGTMANKQHEMRKQSEKIAKEIDKLVQLFSKYNKYAPAEIQIDFHEDWMDDEKYWECLITPMDILNRIQKVDDWLTDKTLRWKGWLKSQSEAMQKLQEEVFAYLGD